MGGIACSRRPCVAARPTTQALCFLFTISGDRGKCLPSERRMHVQLGRNRLSSTPFWYCTGPIVPTNTEG